MQNSIDWDGPLPTQEWSGITGHGDQSHIEVPQVNLPDHHQHIQDHLQFNPLAESQSFGLDVYLNVVACLHNVFNS